MGRKRHLKGDRAPLDQFAEQKARALKALKEYQLRGSFKGRPPALPDMLSEESDRGAVILVGSLIEDVLADRIIEELPNGEKYRGALLRQGGILNSFQDKLIMGQVLGIIDDEIADELNILRAMRNACAHSKVDINLRTPELLEVFCLLIDEADVEDLRNANAALMPRVVFNFLSIYYFELLLGATRAMALKTFQWLLNDALERAREMVAKRKASREGPTA